MDNTVIAMEIQASKERVQLSVEKVQASKERMLQQLGTLEGKARTEYISLLKIMAGQTGIFHLYLCDIKILVIMS